MPEAHPNILYLHSHDTGRYAQPYGHQVPMPNVQALADQGVLFRQAFCAAPTCSASRACLLTGQYGQTNGMLGLAHRGWSLRDYSHHIVHTLRWGPDGRLYFNQSIYIHAHVGTPQGLRTLLGSGVWRFQPETMLRPLAKA